MFDLVTLNHTVISLDTSFPLEPLCFFFGTLSLEEINLGGLVKHYINFPKARYTQRDQISARKRKPI